MDLSKGWRPWRWRTEVTGRGDRRRPRCSRAPAPWLGRGALRLLSASASDPLCSSCAHSSSPRRGAASQASAPTPQPHCEHTPRHPPAQRGSALQCRPASHPAAARRHAAAEFDLGRRASRRLRERGIPEPRAGSGGAPCCPAAGRRPGLAGREPSSFLLVTQINPKYQVVDLT